MLFDKQFVLFLLTFCLAPVALGGQVWRYVDERGVLYFSSDRLHANSELLQIDAQARANTSASGGSKAYSPEQAQALLDLVNRSERYQRAHPDLDWAASTYGVDYALLKAITIAESGFNPRAVSPKGAVGLMQIMPATAQRYGVQATPSKGVAEHLTDPLLNISTGARYLADLSRAFGGRMDLMLAAYNAGENAVKRAGYKIPNYPETQQYVGKVLALYRTQKTGLQ